MAQAAHASEDVILKGYDPQITRRLIGYLRPYWKELAISVVLMIINSAAASVGPYLVGQAVDAGIEGNDLIALRNIVLLYLLVAILQWSAIYLRVNIMARVGQSIIYDLRAKLFDHLQKLSMGFYSSLQRGAGDHPGSQ